MRLLYLWRLFPLHPFSGSMRAPRAKARLTAPLAYGEGREEVREAPDPLHPEAGPGLVLKA